MIGSRAAVWIGTFATAQIYAGAIWLAYVWLMQPRIRERSLAIALAFAVAQTTAILVMLSALFMRRVLAWRRAQHSLQIRAGIEEALALQLVGIDQQGQLQKLLSRSREDVIAAINSVLATVRGDARERLLTLTKNLGVPVANDPVRIETRFAEAVRGNLLRRAVLIEELEANAIEVVPEIAAALASSDPARIATALDMIYGWRRVLPIRGLDPLFHHGDAAIRVRAFRAYPYTSHHAASSVAGGLRDPSPEVRIAAAEAAGRLRMESLDGALESLLSDDDNEVAVAAAFALATLPAGVGSLKRAVASSNRGAAAVAFEALEKATIGRLERA